MGKPLIVSLFSGQSAAFDEIDDRQAIDIQQPTQDRWKRLPERRKTLGNILSEKARALFRDFGFAREIVEILDRWNPERGGVAQDWNAVRDAFFRDRRCRNSEDLGPGRF